MAISGRALAWPFVSIIGWLCATGCQSIRDGKRKLTDSPAIADRDIHGSAKRRMIDLWFSQTPKWLINWGVPFFLRFPCSPPLLALVAAFLAFFR